jgi:redox-sensing transcriptional repressor
MAEFESRVAEMDINMVVLSSPTEVTSELVLPIINAGIKGVLNFTSRPLNFPRGIVLENYDITTLLEKVAYFVKEGERSGDEQ